LLSRGVHFLAVLWIVGMPTLFVFPDRYLNAIPGMTSGRLLFLALIACLALARIFRRAAPVPLHRVEVFAAGYLAIAFLSFLSQLPFETFAGAKVNAALFLQGYMLPFGAFFVARRVAWTRARIEQLLWLLTLVGIFLSIVAVLQQYFGVSVFNPWHIEVINADRAGGTFGNSHELGAVVTSLMMIALLRAFHGGLPHGRVVFYLGAAALMAVALILTKTRGPWLAAMFAFAYLFIHDRRVRPLFIIVGGLGVMAGIALLPFLLDSAVWQQRIVELSPIYNRLTAYATALNALMHHPFYGMGFTDLAFQYAKDRYISDAGPISSYWVLNVGVPHNEFLFIALLTGLPGLTLYLLALGHVHGALARLRRRAGAALPGRLALYADAVVIVFVINALLIDFGLLNYFTIMLYFLAGTAVGYGERDLAAPREGVHAAAPDAGVAGAPALRSGRAARPA
ncbi:MAG: O-antigen ligase family protein, partial [Gammaproteobacteria bacterium]